MIKARGRIIIYLKPRSSKSCMYNMQRRSLVPPCKQYHVESSRQETNCGRRSVSFWLSNSGFKFVQPIYVMRMLFAVCMLV